MENGKVATPLKFKGFYTSKIADLRSYQSAFAKMAANYEAPSEPEMKIRQIVTTVARMAYSARALHFHGLNENDSDGMQMYNTITKGFEEMADGLEVDELLKAIAAETRLPYILSLMMLVDMYLYRVPSYLPPEEDFNRNKEFSLINLISDAFYHLLFVDPAAIVMTEDHPFENIGWMLRQPIAPALYPIRIGELKSAAIDENTL
jgi:hypothetical protein